VVTISVHEILEFGVLGWLTGFTMGFALHGLFTFIERWLER